MSEPGVRRLVGVALNAAVDKTASVTRLVPGAIHRPRSLSMVPGGKAANVVRAARHLGLTGEVVAVLGGHAGRWYAEALAGRGIGIRSVEVPDETRTCLSVLDGSSGSLTEFYEAGVRLAADDWVRIEEALRASIGDDGPGVLVILAGSLPPGAPADAYARLGRVAAGAGARVVVDIAGEPLAAAVAATPWLVKVNAAEAATVTGIATTTRDGALDAARALVAMGARSAIVTRGVAGAVLAGPEGAWSVGGVPTDARGPYAVGSGDAFLAGFAVALSHGAPPDEALRTAVAAGAANARMPGQGELDPREVARIAPGLQVERIALGLEVERITLGLEVERITLGLEVERLPDP